jgi:hypothetical protein
MNAPGRGSARPGRRCRHTARATAWRRRSRPTYVFVVRWRSLARLEGSTDCAAGQRRRWVVRIATVRALAMTVLEDADDVGRTARLADPTTRPARLGPARGRGERGPRGRRRGRSVRRGRIGVGRRVVGRAAGGDDEVDPPLGHHPGSSSQAGPADPSGGRPRRRPRRATGRSRRCARRGPQAYRQAPAKGIRPRIVRGSLELGGGSRTWLSPSRPRIGREVEQVRRRRRSSRSRRRECLDEAGLPRMTSASTVPTMATPIPLSHVGSRRCRRTRGRAGSRPRRRRVRRLGVGRRAGRTYDDVSAGVRSVGRGATTAHGRRHPSGGARPEQEDPVPVAEEGDGPLGDRPGEGPVLRAADDVEGPRRPAGELAPGARTRPQPRRHTGSSRPSATTSLSASSAASSSGCRCLARRRSMPAAAAATASSGSAPRSPRAPYRARH